nr:hypothetical protein [Mycobacterium lepromatosis]
MVVLDHCWGQLADCKAPQYVAVVDNALPRNAGGKLLTGKLRWQVGVESGQLMSGTVTAKHG